jgi:3-oxoacyl-[acyl-carrier-protein] synthase II
MTEGNAARRVVVTGIGIVCSTAVGVADFASALRAGRCGAGPITLFDTAGFAHAQGCQVTGFDPARWLRRVPPGEPGRAAGFAAAAGRMAVRDAGLVEEELRQRRGLVSIGTTDGGSYELDLAVEQEIERGPDGIDAVLVRQTAAGDLSAVVARELGLSRVEAVTVATACSAGNYAIGDGLDALRAGEVDFALCGGADALSRRNFTGFYRLGLLSPDLCRPFDSDRRGVLTGEGAAVLVLEAAEAARARGARVYAEVLGFGLNCDARHAMAPDREGVARCMRLALRDAAVKPDEVDVVSAHATGTKLNDSTEAGAILDVFGPRPPRVFGLKAMLGHTMGAASAMGAAACALAISCGFVPPTINHDTTDPLCPLDCVPNHAVDADVRLAVNNGLAFGGNNAVTVFGRY